MRAQTSASTASFRLEPAPFSVRRMAWAATLAMGHFPVWAQSVATAATERLPDVVVTGNPLRQADVIGPVESLSGEGLLIKRASTLGETLNGVPGVSSSYFGPNANRPVLRGLDGDRVRMLSNSGSSFDASSLSFDHAVAIDPLVIDRIEVLRGPSALLYGGNAMGGVVNSLDNRIPRQPLDRLGGRVELRGSSAASERSGAAVLESGATVAPGTQVAWHADLFSRTTQDLRVPNYVPLADGVALPATDRLRNSASQSSGGAVGVSVHGSSGYFGISGDTYRNNYGIVVEPDVTIRMKREGLAAAGEWRAPVAGLERVRFQLNQSRYEHQEVEGTGAVGTTFRSRGLAGRLEAEHAPLGAWRGLVGVQFESSTFSALGDEAFVPSTQSRQQAVFVVEERNIGALDPTAAGGGRVSLGVRAEQARVASDGDTPDAPETRFGSAQAHRFKLLSASAGALWRLGGGWQVQGSLSHSERAPTFYELYANGLHVATGAFERGNTEIARERGNNLDLALAWKDGSSQLRLGAWASRFSHYIVLAGTGTTFDTPAADGSVAAVPVYAFQDVPAALSGLELSGRHEWAVPVGRLSVDAKLDAVRGDNRATGEPLPRLAPWRTRVGLRWADGRWSARAEVEHASRQSRVASDDVPTAAYTRVNLSGTWRLEGLANTVLYAKVDNLGNTLAYNAASIRTVRDLSPLPGRSLGLGLQARF